MASDEADKTKGRKRIQKSYFDVLGICCSSEVPLVENILRPLEGVKHVTVIIATRTVIVLHDTLLISQPQIAKALNEARLEANVRNRGEHVEFKNKWPSPYSVTCGVLLLLSFLKYVYSPLGWLALGAVAVGIIPIGLKAVCSIRNLRLDINILALVAVIGTVAMEDYLEAGTIVFLFTIAEWLESRASHKANVVMTSLMSMVPQKAVIAETGEVVEADEVKLNTVIAVKAGEVIPIDGVVIEGTCEVDEKTLTGESFPVAKHKDSTVWAGTINLNGYISVKTTTLAEDCAVAKMAVLVEEAQNSKSKTQRLIDQCAKFYTPGVLIISILVAVIPVALRLGNLKKWFHLALVVLVSACPCGLILSTPVATFCALTKAAKSGLLVKGGDYLEALAKIKTLAFDKTGTITRGEFIVTEFKALTDEISLDDLLYWVSSIESKSSHPMASALVNYAKSVSSIEPKPDNVEDYQNFPGEGIYGKIEGQDVYVGNKKISSRASCGTAPSLEGEIKDGRSVGYIYCGGILVGMFSLSDACRSGLAEAIKELKSLGIKTAILTGDSREAAMYTNQQIGLAIDVVHAELLPEDKARLIAEFKKDGAVGMVGDGINDAPALATADVGISMGISGSALATQTGHVVLMSNNIRNIPKVIQISRQAKWKVIQNIALSIVTKLAILALALAGHPLVWAAVLADVGTCVLVILNSMLLLREPHHHAKCRKSIATSDHVHVHGHKCSAGPTKPSPHKAGKHCCTKEKPQQLSPCCGDEKRHASVKSHDHDHDHKHHNHHGHGSPLVVGRQSSSTAQHGSGCCGEQQVRVVEKLCCPTEKPHVSTETRVSKPQTSSPCCGDHKPHNLPNSHDHDHHNHHDHDHDKDHHNHHGHGHDHQHDHASFLTVGSKKSASSTMAQHGSGCCHEEPISFAHKHCASETRVSKTQSASPCCVEEPKSLAQNHHQVMLDDKDFSTIDVIIQTEKNDDSEIRQLIVPGNGCLGFERREMGGCCKSYLKECCSSKHCLTEVVIDH